MCTGHLSRRGLLRGAGVAALTAGLAGSAAADPVPARPLSGPGATLRWLGVAGWELSMNGRRVLFDPYLSRMEYRLPGTSSIDERAPLAVRPDLVDRTITEAPELIMVSHGHWDHAADVPHLLTRFPAARVVCGRSTAFLFEASGVPRKRMIVVRGGENLDFGGLSVQVVPSLHSMTGDHAYLLPGELTDRPRRPRTLGELVEGETFAFQVSFGGAREVLLFGATNYAERELSGLTPDVLVASMTSWKPIHAYPARLVRALGSPPLTVASHHDDMITPLDSPDLPATVGTAGPAAFRAEVAAAGLVTKVHEPAHRKPFVV
ncbi:MBL fold metallo-hydrolase [Allokutzneria albata]|uniref:L-ascorbate metabolism protein UlaG, beta-lactamase superfamily n=1 Tax=Allokutzneria albata TaxID=211114 RepID=A0A1G9T748_ALLAB|nr:MBL fold metallo-hydrolase [Allokutzneria albata]SDM43563.1 L-ascorbate metabolism protein UlaG, beta-lactamase superfamily [Allokutzneria albata]